ncbi:hypothetical protein RFI_18255, partial [Reticulomyxa filosa]
MSEEANVTSKNPDNVVAENDIDTDTCNGEQCCATERTKKGLDSEEEERRNPFEEVLPFETLKKKYEKEIPFEAVRSLDSFNQFMFQIWQSGDEDVVQPKEFIKNLRDVKGMTLLHCACINDAPVSLIHVLVGDYKCNINECDNDGYSPLMYAANQWSENVIISLLKFKPRLDVTTQDIAVH